MTTTSQQLIRVRVTYDWDTRLTDDGRSFSRETTVWHGVGAAAAADAELQMGCRRAALAYPEYVSGLMLGLIGVRALGEDAAGPAMYIRPAGPTILKFGPMHQESPQEVFWPIVGGWLAIVRPDRPWDGRLSFRWWRDAGREIFQTELSDFRPAIRGRRPRAPLRGLAYRWTQTHIHTFTMLMFHRWVRRQRDELLRRSPLLAE